jgi:hypothetical protein
MLTGPPTVENHSFKVLAKRVASLPASCCRRSRSRPCPCKSSCLCSRCRSPCSRPCPCRNFGPYRRAFLSPSCQPSSLCPERKRKLSPRAPDWKPGCWRWCPRASPRPPHPLVGTDLTLSFPQRPPDQIYCLHFGQFPCPKTVKPLSAMVGT